MPEPEIVHGLPTGMDIAISNMPPKRSLSRVDNVLRKLQQRYPFVSCDGKRVILNGLELESLPLPRLENRIEKESEWYGHAYHLVAGITNEPTAPWEPGFTIMLRDRVMEAGKSYGCGEYGTSDFSLWSNYSKDVNSTTAHSVSHGQLTG